MAQISKILRTTEGNGLMFKCVGCGRAHRINIGEGPGPRWSWNNNPDKPTFSPSVLVRYEGTDAGIDGAPPSVCHSFVVDGQIQYLGDCTHPLAGQTVPLGEWA